MSYLLFYSLHDMSYDKVEILTLRSRDLIMNKVTSQPCKFEDLGRLLVNKNTVAMSSLYLHARAFIHIHMHTN